MNEITPDVDTSAVLERLGVGRNEELRQSGRRRSYLEKLSRVITPERPNVRLDPNHSTACVNQEKNRPLIRITTREFDQHATTLSRDVYDMTIQEALLIHEVGHVLYTDHGAFQRTLSRVDLSWKKSYKRLWNCLEDGAIEEQLRRRFNVEDEIFVANANIMAQPDDESQSRELDLYNAVTIACLDLAVFNSGKLEQLQDPNNDDLTIRSDIEEELFKELLPITKNAVADVVTESDPVDRTEVIYDYWEEVEKRLNDAEDDGQSQDDTKGEGQSGDDGESTLGDLFGDNDSDGDSGGEGQTVVMPISKPDDTENADIGGGQSADELGEQDEEEVKDDLDAVADPEQESREQGDEEEEEEGSGGGEGGDGEEREENIEETRRDQLRQEGEEVDGAEQLLGEIEEYGEAMENLDAAGDADDVRLRLPDDRELTDLSRWNEAQRRSRQVAQLLKSSLREERRSRRVKNQRRGRFDRSRMVNAERGSTRVFESQEEGNEKDYDCMIVVDRSGSMGGSRMRTAEDAITALALGLEEVSVGVSVLGMHRNNARLENAFGRDIENDRGKLLSLDTAGGTPLSDTLALGRERMEQKADSDNRFMIVVTDGKPANRKKYKEQLDKCTFPVLGVYVETNEDDSDVFHRSVNVEEGDISEAITRLAREAMI